MYLAPVWMMDCSVDGAWCDANMPEKMLWEA